MGGDRLEAGLTWSLPWLVLLLAATGQAFLNHPRPRLSDPDRQYLVGRPSGGGATIHDEPDGRPIGELTRPALVDLGSVRPDWSKLVGLGWTPRTALDFSPEPLQAALAATDIETGALDLEVEVAWPVPAAGEVQVAVLVRPFALLPPATWDLYVYTLADGRLIPVLRLLDQPARPTAERGLDGRWAYGSRSLERRNRRYVWTGSKYVEEPLRPPVEQVARLLGGALAGLPWWGWLVVALPVGALLAPVVEAWRALTAAGPAVRARAGWLAGGAWLLSLPPAVAGLVWLRLDPSFDLPASLLAPVLLTLPVTFAAITARTAGR